MEEEYNRKFEDMQKFIPFLDTMIERLEDQKNPRHAQLSKTKALRDLLLDRSKRMKMDNLLKCEQVLKNLYAKIEQKEPGIKTAPDRPKVGLDSARQKLKVISKQTENVTEDEQGTLPEIERADQDEVVCTSGSKEPALFQRRPNKVSPSRSSTKEDQSNIKRNYTRRLVSPERSPHRKSGSESSERDKRMFQRRSPKRSPAKSPSQQKRKSRRDSDKGLRDVNILLEVPQKSLKALNTENIGERIMNCDEKDVNIDQLKELRSKILFELQKTGSNDDISEIIMKSYKKNDVPKQKLRKKIEVEDGEISDSESETIDHVYGNLVNVNDNKTHNEKEANVAKTTNEGDSKKIQIQFVVGDAAIKKSPINKISTCSTEVIDLDKISDCEEPNPNVFEIASKSESLKEISPEPTLTIDLLKNDKEDVPKEAKKSVDISSDLTPKSTPCATAIDIFNITKAKIHLNIPKVIEPRKANFYTPISECDELQHDENKVCTEEDSIKNTSEIKKTEPLPMSTPSDIITSPQKHSTLVKEIISVALEKVAEKLPEVTSDTNPNEEPKSIVPDSIKTQDVMIKKSTSLKIPFIGDVSEKPMAPKENVVSELDILQALKNDILSEPMNLPNTETPTLHQPKLTKVTNVKEITKKKITLDKYKQKTLSSKSSFKKPPYETLTKVQSRGLTEKECERFKLPCRLSLDAEYSSEEEPHEKRTPSPTDTIYGDLAPQSPDAQPQTDESLNAPVIIPAEPLKPPVVASKSDIDMRTLPLSNKTAIKPNVIKEMSIATSEKNSPRPHDPRLRKDVFAKANDKIGSPHCTSSGTAPLPVPSPFSASPSPFPNMTPSRTPSSRAFEIGTPTHQTFDLSDTNLSKKHVYAPSFVPYDTSDVRESSTVKESCTSVWDKNERSDLLKRDGSRTSRSRWDDGRNVRRNDDYNYEHSSHRENYKDRHTRPIYEKNDYRDNYPTTPVHSFGKSDAPRTPLPSFGRSEAPTTPLPSFGRLDAQKTPLPSFGRSDPQRTPLTSFGRSECPTTPIHPFGRSEMPRTPSHPFGRSDYAPSTPSHPFGRSEYQRSSSHSYGKPQDNRGKRSDYDSRLDKNARHHNRNSYGNEKVSYSRNDQYDRDIYSRRNDSKIHSPERRIGQNYTREEYAHDTMGNNDDYYYNQFKDYHDSSIKPDNRYENDGDKYRHESRRQQYEKSHRPQFEQTAAKCFSRRPSVGRYEEKPSENTVSIEADAGRSFTIDTSVNATFQGFDKSLMNSSFDARRQRAASVGRVNMRENSVGRSFLKEANIARRFERGSSVGRSLNTRQESTFQKGHGRALAEAFVPSFSKHFYTNKPINRFARAQSVGRDLVQRPSKTFAETKAEFESYKVRTYEKHSKDKNTFQVVYKNSQLKEDSKIKNPDSSDKYFSKDNNEPYSPRKNLRDPRMKQQRHQDKYHVDNRQTRNPRDRAFGIVYSNDNIAKGNVLGPGVKNYKIPKIKKPTEEASAQDSDTNRSENLKSSDSETTKPKNREPSNKKIDGKESKSMVSNVVEETKKDIKTCPRKAPSTKNSKEPKQNKEGDYEILPQRSRNRKKVVYNSDSEEEIVKKYTSKEIAEKAKVDIKKTFPIDNTDDIVNESESDYPIDIFNDNLASDDVIENIDNLIADLDKDIGNKFEGDLVTHITKDDVFDSLFENLDKIKNCGPRDELAKINTNAPVSNDTKKGEDEDLINMPKRSVTVANEIQSNFSEMTLPNPQEKHIASSPQKVIPGSPQKIIPVSPQKTIPGSLQTINPGSPQKIIPSSPPTIASASPQKIIPVSPQKIIPGSPQKIILGSPQKIIPSSPQKIIPDSPQKSVNPDSPQKTTMASPNALRSPKNLSPIIYANKDSLDYKINNEAEVADDLPEASQINLISLVTTSAQTEPDNTHAIDNQENSDMINSTPDSTIETDELNSKNGDGQDPEPEAVAQPENMNPDVSSTHDSNDQSAKESIVATNNENTDIGSINSIISLLQDKNKIKELLSLIGNQQEGEKLKKKLEKLSEIVSDDDDDKSNTAPNQVEGTSENLDKPEGKSPEQEKLEALRETTEAIPQSDTSSDKINDNLEDDQPEDDSDVPIARVSKTPRVKKTQVKRKGIGKRNKKKAIPKLPPKRITRAVTAQKPNKPNRELKKLHDDIRDMFMSSEVLNATGIRMCRLAKLSEEPSGSAENDNDSVKTKGKSISKKEEIMNNSNKPLVVIEKMTLQEPEVIKPPRKKPGPKPKPKPQPKPVEEIKAPTKRKPGPKSKTKISDDPYEFESDSRSETTTKASENSEPNSSSDSENESIASSSTSVGSSELLIELKTKQKRRRTKGGWKSGVIRRNKKKAQSSDKQGGADPKLDLPLAAIEPLPTIPDYDCFTDVRYSFEKYQTSYPCRLCNHRDDNIVSHYKNNHPHYEIPLSRLKQNVAKEAIKQSMVTNFQKISNVPLNKYVCRFCNKVFDDKRKPLLEIFFWHVVSSHTGEYKQLCSECLNTKTCTFMLDIPPPPKNVQGLLMGYICGKCFYTQVSLENLKNHVSLRHNDEETEVYTISLATITQQMVETMQNSVIEDTPRTLRNSKQYAPTDSKENSDYDEMTENIRPLSVQSKISFEDEHGGKLLKNESESDNEENNKKSPENTLINTKTSLITTENTSNNDASNNDSSNNDIFEHAHLRINISSSGTKEYICAATGGDDHYKTTLLISIKQHVQRSHATQNWDGYCYFCKVIVMPQGRHSYKDCLTHFLDKHLEDGIVKDIPAEIETSEPVTEKEPEIAKAPTPPTKTYISVKPMSQLLTTAAETAALDDGLPKIQSVVSLNSEVLEEPTIPLPISLNEPVAYTETVQKDVATKPKLEYEESLKRVMSNKYRIALDTMLTDEKLSHVYKCPSRFCSFTCDSPEDALIHCSTHLRMGCTDALRCSYCSFDCTGDYIELVSHVFKDHGNCKFSCTSCFYRARSVAMVEIHCQKAHDGGRKCAIVSSIVVAPIQSVVLSRKEAVKTYSCAYGQGMANMCNFKTATPDKFCSHISSDHPDLTSYRCSECPESATTLALLIEHLSQKHQLKSFQCSWCIFGAETRMEILNHCTTKHPIEMPQAYWRKIITKEGAPPKVLPLVSLSGSAQFNTVEPNPAPRSDPVREAERADALERLVEVSSQVTESEAPDFDLPEDSHDAEDMPSPEEPLDLPMEEPIAPSIVPNEGPEPNTMGTATDTTDADRATPILKKEPIDEADVKPMTSAHIISLDSDDEDANLPEAENVIELSDSDGEGSVLRKKKRVAGPRVRACDVYACRKCKNLFKNAAVLKRHLIYCYGADEQLSCPHCTDVFLCTNTLVKHLKFVHAPEEIYVCGICYAKETEATKMRNHLSSVHSVTKFLVNMVVSEDSLIITHTFKPEIIITPPPSAKRGPKRKRSSTAQSSTPPKVKKFSPEQIDNLPITPIFDENVYCSLCEFNTKVKVNMVRHLQAHTQNQPDLPEIAPVNPVPHLESNEMHFDRMVNLASSSITTTPEQSSRSELVPAITVHVPPAIAARYPKYVPDRKRYACGAKNCNYISIDEAMLNYHWETLHSGSNDYHCVHCPPNQHLDTSRALTATRIIAHLKMHDMKLYSCSECTYYHHLRHFVEKHIGDKHKTGAVKIVREPVVGPVASTSTVPTPGPTMDLKPWQCGLCKFNDMLRPKVVEHCSRYHNSKFQFKCMFCPWRSSAKENVVKHHLNAHQQHNCEVFYFYYQEGSLPVIDGRPVWVIQKENSKTPDVKEDPEPVPENVTPVATENIEVNVDLVKKEPVDGDERSSDSLCKKYGPLCDPNGLLYKCPFCKVAAENNKVSMQSHLYEELKYRRWACNICSYKAFHKQGLKDHASSEHKGVQENSTELPQDVGIESWVTLLLNHQDKKITENLAKVNNMATPVQKGVVVTQPAVATLNASNSKTNEQSSKADFTNQELEKAFGSFGTPVNMMFSCPKCEFKTKDESKMGEHLEMELTKVRWCCNLCEEKYTQYHQAQLHCRTGHVGAAARPLEALRDPEARRAWPLAVIAVQKLSMNVMPFTTGVVAEPETYTPPVNNDLLVVRYEENVPDPDQPRNPSVLESMLKVTSEPVLGKRKRPGFLGEADSDDEKLIIDERPSKKHNPIKKPEVKLNCPYCTYSTKACQALLNIHILAHYDLKPFYCAHCSFMHQKTRVVEHSAIAHPDLPLTVLRTQVPNYPPKKLELGGTSKGVAKQSKPSITIEKPVEPENKAPVVTPKDKVFICLICQQEVLGTATQNHVHPNEPPQYAKKGDLILKCTTCSILKNNLPAMKLHHNKTHPLKNLDYVYTKLLPENTGGLICKVSGCGRKFGLMEELKRHNLESHASDPLSFTITPSTSVDGPSNQTIQEALNENTGEKRRSTDELHVVAKKSTTKLPCNSKIAKKSTTKLPMLFVEDSSSAEEGFSFYGSKPAPLEEYSSVKTHLPFMNSGMPFTVNKLKDIVDITPKIVVKKVTEPES